MLQKCQIAIKVLMLSFNFCTYFVTMIICGPTLSCREHLGLHCSEKLQRFCLLDSPEPMGSFILFIPIQGCSVWHQGNNRTLKYLSQLSCFHFNYPFPSPNPDNFYLFPGIRKSAYWYIFLSKDFMLGFLLLKCQSLELYSYSLSLNQLVQMW